MGLIAFRCQSSLHAVFTLLSLTKVRSFDIMIISGKSLFNCIRFDKGKPIERWGRKATGLPQCVVNASRLRPDRFPKGIVFT